MGTAISCGAPGFCTIAMRTRARCGHSGCFAISVGTSAFAGRRAARRTTSSSVKRGLASRLRMTSGCGSRSKASKAARVGRRASAPLAERERATGARRGEEPLVRRRRGRLRLGRRALRRRRRESGSRAWEDASSRSCSTRSGAQDPTRTGATAPSTSRAEGWPARRRGRGRRARGRRRGDRPAAPRSAGTRPAAGAPSRTRRLASIVPASASTPSIYIAGVPAWSACQAVCATQRARGGIRRRAMRGRRSRSPDDWRGRRSRSRCWRGRRSRLPVLTRTAHPIPVSKGERVACPKRFRSPRRTGPRRPARSSGRSRGQVARRRPDPGVVGVNDQHPLSARPARRCRVHRPRA